MLDKIAVIGDSHVSFFGGNELVTFIPIIDQNGRHVGMNNTGDLIENFTTFHLGGALAYNLEKYGSSNRTREKIDLLLSNGIIRKGQPILCCFGEVDCRVHVLRQAESRKVHFKTVVDDILNNYFSFLLRLRKDHPVYVWGPIPTQKDGSVINPEVPYYGTEAERNLATAYFNEALEKLCRQCDIQFLSVFRHLVDENNKTRSEYITDGCHLSQRAWAFAFDEWKSVGVDVKFTPRWYAHSFNLAIECDARQLGSLDSTLRAEEMRRFDRIRSKFVVMDVASKGYVRMGATNAGGFVMVNDFLNSAAVYDCMDGDDLSWSTSLLADLDRGGG